MLSRAALLCICLAAIGQAAVVTEIEPHEGSLWGGMRLTIKGSGFAKNQFNYGDGSTHLGNHVVLVSETRSYVCDIHKDGCTETQIMCYTRAMVDDNYYVHVAIDGEKLSKDQLCSSNEQNCRFSPSDRRTPHLREVSPRTGSPGGLVTMSGRIYSNRFSSHQESSDNGRIEQLTRVYFGGQKCELLEDFDLSIPYSLVLNNDGQSDDGHMTCLTQGTYVGNVNGSFLVEAPFGRSYPDGSVLKVFADNSIAMYQTYATVTDISPKLGSLVGGTRLNITGLFFDDTDKPIAVQVAGAPCQVESSTTENIICSTPPVSEAKPSYRGGRGLTHYVWEGTTATSVAEFDALNFTYSTAETRIDTASIKHNSTGVSTISKGLLVAPTTGEYSFELSGKVRIGQLLISLDSNETKKESLISRVHSSDTSFTYLHSTRVSMVAGNEYYVELRHSSASVDASLSLAVRMYNTDKVQSQTGSAWNEQQRLQMTSTIVPEDQAFDISGLTAQSGVNEVQMIDIVPITPENTADIRLGLDGVFSNWITSEATHSQVAAALNSLPTISPDTVTVSRQTVSPSGYRYVVTFNSERGTWPLVEIQSKGGLSSTSKVTRSKTGVPTNNNVVLEMDGVPTQPISKTATSAQVKSIFEELFSVRCSGQLTSPRGSIYNEQFENLNNGWNSQYSGRVVSDQTPFCGRKSILNPAYIINKPANQAGSVSANPYVCFAYNGSLHNLVTMNYSYVQEGLLHAKKQRFRLPEDTFMPYDEQWHYSCFSIGDLLKDAHPEGLYMRVNQVIIARDNVYDTLIDSVFWGSKILAGEDVVGSRAMPPHDYLMNEVQATSDKAGAFSVKLYPVDCLNSFNVMQARNVQASIQRQQGASPPVGGTFNLEYSGSTIHNINADISASALESLLETLPGMGGLSVSRSGICHSFRWTIDWLQTGGDRPSVSLDTSSITGIDADIIPSTLRDGYVEFNPVIGDMIFEPNELPQVTVSINGIPSACDGICSFDYSAMATPQVATVNPVSGPSDQSLTITGTNLSPVGSVTVGGFNCTVTNSSDTRIVCDLSGITTRGENPVVVSIDGQGNADGSLTYMFVSAVTASSPASSHRSGGYEVVIKGSGLFDAQAVTHTNGNGSCMITNANDTHVTCIMQPTSAAGLVDLDLIFTGGYNLTYSGFTFTNDISSGEITALSTTQASVLGVTELMIEGSGFGTAEMAVEIGYGNAAAILGWNDTHIKVTLPAISRGSYPLLVSTLDGYADTTAVGDITYALEVTDMDPRLTSILGGTVHTFTGVGFGTNSSVVSINLGSTLCDIISISDVQIVCKTRIVPRIHSVNNDGSHAIFGKYYAWNPPLITIEEGDTVEWTWRGPDDVGDVGYLIAQTDEIDSIQATVNGFGSTDGPTTHGSYLYRFTEPGVFNYWSGPVDPKGAVKMRGRVEVMARSPWVADVSVEVGGKEASVYLASLGSRRKREVKRATCVPEKLTCTPVPQQVSSCMENPVVDMISPLTGTPTDVITISGSGFSPSDCNNYPEFGGIPCAVISSANDTIQCVLDITTQQPAVGVILPLALFVDNIGDAALHITGEAFQGFTLQPVVTGLSRSEGSLAGGQNLTISGSGFVDVQSTMVTLGFAQCTPLAVDYNSITCVTTAGAAWNGNTTVHVRAVNGESYEALCVGDCLYSYNALATPLVNSVSPDQVSSGGVVLTLTGSKLGADVSGLTVTIGDTICDVIAVADTEVKCMLSAALPAGEHVVTINVHALGLQSQGPVTVTSEKIFNTISPSSGSVHGGLEVTLEGNGFSGSLADTTVDFDGSSCEVTTVTTESILCMTSAHADDVVSVTITSRGQLFDAVNFTYSTAETPTIDTLTPTDNSVTDTITIRGMNLLDVSSITIDGEDANILSSADDSVSFKVKAHSAGVFPVVVHVAGKGLANAVNFEYILEASTVYPASGAPGGGQTIAISGSGYDSSTKVTVCGDPCKVIDFNATHVFCKTPPSTDTSGADITCDVNVTQLSLIASLAQSYEYNSALSGVIQSVSPARGGTAGGTTLTIEGTGFDATSVNVTIDGVECEVIARNETNIICMTGEHKGSGKFDVVVELEGSGNARSEADQFYYVDVWSSRFTWGGEPLPAEGELVVIPPGQTLLLDTNTPTLKVLLIQGELIFDEMNVELQAENILISSGGRLQVGTEDEPFQHKAIITMWGHLRSLEMPIYGAKTLAVRNGTLDLHGQPRLAWTMLDATANAGTNQLVLQNPVDWEAGDHIAIASTGKRHSQKENEEMIIQSVSADGRTVTLTENLAYKHLGETSHLGGGHHVEMRAEVGLLTHNVLFRGSINHQWDETIPACAAGFDTGEFAVQTCFQGRFGEEMGSDEFGAAIMMHAPERDTQAAVGRISHIEVTHAGQAFRLGRYPIHFHLNGNMNQSYVKGSSIHRTFNRAINVHNTHNVLIQNNVIYHVMGGAVFLEDSAETGNILEYNLAIFVIPSTSLLNDDVTPAAFWVTHPTNIVRHNHAAGGSHFGFWYRMHPHPNGPSADPTKCPQNAPLGEFSNNTVHSQGWFGLWTFDNYFPKSGNGLCAAATTPIPAVFETLTAWHCEKGAEWVNGGSLQFDGFLLANNEKAGIEGKQLMQHEKYSYNGAIIKNSVIAGQTGITTGCTNRGIVLPFSPGLIVSNITFVGFNVSGCSALGVTSIAGKCTELCGGWTYKFEGMRWINTDKKAAFRWTHEAALEDLDGSFSGKAQSKVVPTNPTLDPSICSSAAEFSHGSLGGSLCDTPHPFHRYAWNNIQPGSLKHKNAELSNEHGLDLIPYAFKRLTHMEGWMCMMMGHSTYTMGYENGGQFTNTSHSAKFYNFKSDDYLIMEQSLYQRPDRFIVAGESKAFNTSLTYEDNIHGDYTIDENNKFSYIISGKTSRAKRDAEDYGSDKAVNFKVYTCYFNDCIPPPDPNQVPPPMVRPDDAKFWSQNSAWDNSEAGWGGNNEDGTFSPPKEGTNVKIQNDDWMVLDTMPAVINELWVNGVLEFEWQQINGVYLDYTLSVTHIFLNGGRLFVGWEDHPMRGNVDIILRGDISTPEIYTPFGGPTIGAKAIGVFGSLDMHGLSRDITWTHLAETAEAGATSITLIEAVDWVSGDEIAIATSGLSTWENEQKKIVSVSSDKMTINLDSPLDFKHTGEPKVTIDGYSYRLAAEVGLLTRNVKVVGEEHDEFATQSFGGRILVGDYFDGFQQWTGFARIENVEFMRMGQEGYTEYYDPRTAVAYLNTAPVSSIKPSYVRKNTFHSNQNAAIAVVNAPGLEVEDNVIFHTVEAGIMTETSGLTLRHNLVMHSLSRACYQDRYETSNFEHHGAIEVMDSTDIVMQDNAVAGSERIGYAISGMPCSHDSSRWNNNVAHGVLSGATILPEFPGVSPCNKITGFTVYHSNDFAIYAQVSSSTEMSNLTLVDNKLGILPLQMGPGALSHTTSDKYFKISNSLIVGSSDNRECGLNFAADPDDCSQSVTGAARSWLSPNGGSIGMAFGQFMGGGNEAPRKPWKGLMSYNSNGGKTIVDGVTLAKFGSACGSDDYAISTSPGNDDGQHPLEISNIKLVNVEENNKFFFHRPNVGKINSADCVDMDCDALKKCMIKDHDGTFLGEAGATAIPQSEYEWGENPRRGLGDYRIPKTLLTDLEGNRIDVDAIAPYKGIIGNRNCTWKSAWTAYLCDDSLNYEMMLIESMDADTETRRLSPVAILGEKYIDLINGPQDHGWCSGYTCRKRVSTFMSLVATDRHYEMHFTATSPQQLRLQMLNTDETSRITMSIYYSISNRIDVYVDGGLMPPLNAKLNGKEVIGYEYPTTHCQYCPKLASPHGSNYQNRWEQLLFVSFTGKSAIDIKMSDLIMVTFELFKTVEEFFDDDTQIVNNLALFFGVPPEKVRVVNVISENAQLSGRKKRALDANSIIVQFEIGDSPTVGIDDTILDSLDVNQLTVLRDELIDAAQTGQLPVEIGLEYSKVYVSVPLPDPSDPSWSTVAAEAAEYTSEVIIPANLKIAYHDTVASEGVPLENVTIQLVNSAGEVVNQFGTIEWKVAVKLANSSGATLRGDHVVPFVNGQATFNNLILTGVGNDNVLSYYLVSPDNLTHIRVDSDPLEVIPRELYATATTPDMVEVGQDFALTIQLYDFINNLPARDLNWNGLHEFHVTIALNPFVYYGNGSLTGGRSVDVDPVTGTAFITPLSFNARNGYVLDLIIDSTPAEPQYNTTSITDLIYATEPNSRPPPANRTDTVRLVFKPDNYQRHPEYLAVTVYNEIIHNNPYEVSISPLQCDTDLSCVFDLMGSEEEVEATLANLYAWVRNKYEVKVDGQPVEATGEMIVNGDRYHGAYNTTPVTASIGMPTWLIAIIVLLCLLALSAVAVGLAFKMKQSRKVQENPTSSNSETSLGNENSAFRVSSPPISTQIPQLEARKAELSRVNEKLDPDLSVVPLKQISSPATPEDPIQLPGLIDETETQFTASDVVIIDPKSSSRKWRY